jgi:hypothetical protein
MALMCSHVNKKRRDQFYYLQMQSLNNKKQMSTYWSFKNDHEVIKVAEITGSLSK